MKSIKHFEEIKAWKDARELTNQFYVLTARTSFDNDQGIGSHLRQESGRIMAKLAEGSGVGSDEAFIPFVNQARELAAGLQSYLYLALDHQCIDQEEFQKTHDEIESLKNQMQMFILYLMRPENKKVEVSASSNTISRMDLFDKLGD